MEKRIFLAIVISIGLLWAWAAVAPKIFPELARKAPAATSTATTTATSSGTTTAAPSTAAPAGATLATAVTTPAVNAAPVRAERVQLTVVDRPDFVATFSNRGAQLVSFKLKRYKGKRTAEPVDLVKARAASYANYPFFIVSANAAANNQLNTALWAVSESDDRGQRVIEYRYAAGGLSATKTFRFGDSPYLFDYAVAVSPALPYRVGIGPGISNLAPEEKDTQVVMTGNGVVKANDKFKIVNRGKASGIQVYSAVQYLGIEDNYFMTALRPAKGGDGVLSPMRMVPANKKEEARVDLFASINAGSDGALTGEAFFGPKETGLLDQYGMGDALQFGWFSIIARFFLKALVWIHQYTMNYGFAIVVLTILIKIVLYPLQHKSIVSMKKMQRVQPKVEGIKAKYKKSKTDPDQRQKMNVEMMALYQKEGINPMAGCLPILLQLPILWGFYNLLSRAIELRGAPFMLWIHDLSDKDPTYVLPILMTATMFIQTYITPATGDPMQRRIFLFMPLIFGFLFKDFPSGLVLYWLVQNVLTIVQQLIMNKWWKNHPEDLQTA